jgi:DNA-binding beta-propeller fold protein YncE
VASAHSSATPSGKPPSAADASPVGNAFHLSPANGRGDLAPGSDPSALPGDVLIADEDNNRLLLVDPFGRIRWQFPSPDTARQARAFGSPDDAFISPDGATIVATEEMDDAVALISIADDRVTRRYGHLYVPGSATGYFSHPDDAMLLPGGDLLLADIINCRILVLSPGGGRVVRKLGTTDVCGHQPPTLFGSPNGVFPLTDGHFLVTEINNDWVDDIDLHGHVYWSTHPPGVAYPSDANEVSPGRYIVADYSSPGQIVIFNRAGRTLWRFKPTGANALNHPSLALPLPNGDVLANDDYNDRVIVIDPRTNRIVWQYGHRGVSGHAPGYLANPDGVDMAPPYSLLITHAATIGRP